MSTSKQQALESQLAKIEAQIQTGISSTNTDGTSVTVDLNALREEAKRLREEIATTSRKRPRVGALKIW